ncbi:HtaA domain-containing protein, partial [Microbacterium sp.]|uniref:HtaA domain-containing protein n=1 Tax=Microbacterium sp. TaxID=51671 RepID=UPI00289BC4A3
AHFFDVKLSNISVVVSNGTASIVADTYLWAGIDFGSTPQGTHENQDVVLADVANAVVSVDGGQVSVSGTGVTVSSAGAAANPLYAAGAALDDFTITADVEEGSVVPEPAAGADDISVTLPEKAVEPEPSTGSFGWEWATDSPVSLGTATESNGSFVASGALNDIAVTDTRAGGTGNYSWELTGKVSDFVSGSNSFTAQQLAINPKVSNAGSSVVAGEAVRGLVNPVRIAGSSAASSATVSADLSLVIPSTTPAGDYKATVTITAVG